MLVLLLLSLGIIWYCPVVVSARIGARAMGPVGWLEGSIYTGLLFVAGFVCILNLLGTAGRIREVKFLIMWELDLARLSTGVVHAGMRMPEYAQEVIEEGKPEAPTSWASSAARGSTMS